MKDTLRGKRIAMSLLLVVAGLFMIIVVPSLVHSTLTPMLKGLMRKAAQDPNYANAPGLMVTFYILWQAIIVFAGVVALAIAHPLAHGEEWTWPVALTCLAAPAVGGMYMMLPYVSFVEGHFPPPMPMILVGVCGYWALLLLKKSEHKWIDLGVFTLLGVASAGSFVLGFGAMRQLTSRPGKPLFINEKMVALSFGGPLNWIAAILIFASISLLARRKTSGWWVALIGALCSLIGSLPTYLITSSAYYLIGIGAGGLLAVVLFIPGIKKAFAA